MVRRLVIASLALLAIPFVASAQPISGLYVGGEVGPNFAGSLLASGNETKIYADPGILGLADLGWGFGNGLRVEIEGSGRSNAVNRITTQRIDGRMLPLAGAGGSIDNFALMTNLLYDLDLRRFGTALRPYVGVGFGYDWMDFAGVGGTGAGRFTLPQNNTFVGPDHVSFDSVGGAFAYQAIVGVAYPIRLLPWLEATVEYRYFGTANITVPVQRVALGNFSFNGATPSSRILNSFSNQDQSIMLGLRFRFDRP